jgi:hypothetical protein
VLVSVIAGCQTAFVDTIPLPPALPKAAFQESPAVDGGNGVVFKNMPTLTITWHRPPGVVELGNAVTYSDEQLAADADAFFDAWQAFEAAIEPRPYSLTGGTKNFAVWVTDPDDHWKIKNDYDDPLVVIERFYLPNMVHGSYGDRVDAYVAFQELIMGIVDNIQETLEERELSFYEDALAAMEALIQEAFPEKDLSSLPPPGDDGKSAFSEHGRLVDYFFGAIPVPGDYYPAVFPDAP